MDDLKFQRARMFDWLSPLGLLLTGAKVMVSGTFARYADKREMEATIPVTRLPDYSAEDEVWVDYVADLGDGFDATYGVARQLARERLQLRDGGATYDTRRGRVLVMGGDQVYPTADENAYLNKFIGPYEAAFPWFEPEDRAPLLFAIPGNHDWYDGLTAFMRLLCRRSWIGGWRTEQQRSYFAIKLPGHWWLWGIDIQFDTYIDEPQLEYFRGVVAGTLRPGSPKVEAGDQIILCTGTPSWVHEGIAGDEKYKSPVEPRRNLRYFEAKIVRENGADVRIGVSGDLHHYARYESRAGRQRITAGGGGAYLYPTHVLDQQIQWQDEGTSTDASAPRAAYRQRVVYPDRTISLKLRFGALLVPRNNPSFAVLTALVSLVIYWVVLFSLAPGGRATPEALHAAGWWQIALSLLRAPVGMLFVIVTLGSLYGFADAVRRWEKVAMAAAHGLAQIAVAVTVVWGASRLPGIGGRSFLALVALLVAVGGALGGSLTMGAYLVGSQLFKRHPNENFASQHIAGYKNFLRMRIRSDGTVTIFPIGLERVPKDWRIVQSAGSGDPYLEPDDDEEQPHLIEGPIEVKS